MFELLCNFTPKVEHYKMELYKMSKLLKDLTVSKFGSKWSIFCQKIDKI